MHKSGGSAGGLWAASSMGTDQVSSDRFYKLVSNSTRRSLLLALAQFRELSFSDLMREIGMHPSHDTGYFNYHLNLLIKEGAVTSHEGAYALTKLGESIARGLPKEEEECEVYRLEPVLDTQPVEVVIEEKEEEGIVVPKPPWKAKTIYFYESTHRTPARSEWMYDTYQLFCLDVHPVEYKEEKYTGVEWLRKTYSPTYHGLAKHLEEGRVEVLPNRYFLESLVRSTDILKKEGRTITEYCIKRSAWLSRHSRQAEPAIFPEPSRRDVLPKLLHVYPIDKKALCETYEGGLRSDYGGEYRVTLGQKTYDTIKAIHSGKGDQSDSVLVEEYINTDGVPVLFATILNQKGAEHFKVENWKQSPSTTINNQTYYLATETYLRDTTAYR